MILVRSWIMAMVLMLACFNSSRAAEKTAKSKVVQEVPAPKEESEEKKKETDEKKAATVEAMEKFEKQEHKKAKKQEGGKVNKAQQVRKNSLKAR